MKKYKFIEEVTFAEVNLVLRLNRLVDFESNVLNRDNVYRITSGMLADSQIDKIKTSISTMDSKDVVELNQKDGLYKIFQQYTNLNPMGYLLYRGKGKNRVSYLFDGNLKLLAKKHVENSQINLEALQILPTDWLKMRNEKYNNVETNLDKEFVDRTNFENFTIDGLNSLKNKVANALKSTPNNDKLKAQFATLLMQKLPNRGA